jgi:hypothetical protein
MAYEKIEPAFEGLDTDTAQDYLDKRRAPLLRNFLVDRPGKLPIRGPIFDSIDLYAGALAEKPAGIWQYGNNLLVGLKANSATAMRDPWVSPYRRTSTTGDLSNHHTTMYHVNLDTRVTTAVAAATAITTPGPRSARLGASTYGISFNGTADETVGGGLQRRTQLCRWGGTAVLPTTIATTFAPSCMQDVKVHLNRLFVLGGNVPGTTGAVKANSLFWSDVDGPVAGTLAEWQDDVSGLVNQLVVDSDDTSDFGVGLAKLESGLVIFKRRSIHMLRGQTPAAFSLRTVTQAVGCIDPRSIVEYQGAIYFMSHQGFMRFDGSEITNTTSDLRTSLLANAIAAVGDAGVDGGAVIASNLGNDYIGVTISKLTNTAATPSTNYFSAMYHVPTKAWVSLTSDALSARAPIGVGRTLSKTFIVDDQRIFDGSFIVAPETTTEDRRGIDAATPIFTLDASGGGPLMNGTGNTIKNQLTLVEAWTSLTYSTIPAAWQSRLARLAQPGARTALKRLLLDYTFQVDAAADDGGSGWYVTVLDGQGNVLLSEIQVPIQGDPSTYAFRRQHAVDMFCEANDLQLRVEWRGTTTYALTDASLFGAYVEFQPAQQRGSG